MNRYLADLKETLAVAAEFSTGLQAGDLVFLEGALGAGKTTLVRGVLRGLGYADAVRSPTFNLIQSFPTVPPVMHADLYRVSSSEGVGIEEYLDSYLCFVEWPDRFRGALDSLVRYRIHLAVEGEGRRIMIQER